MLLQHQPARTVPACKPLTAHAACPHLSLFCRERRWKMTHAKRFAGQIKRSNLDVESRQQVRAKEELQALRKQAAFVGKEVGIRAEWLVGLSKRALYACPSKAVLPFTETRVPRPGTSIWIIRWASALYVLHPL